MVDKGGSTQVITHRVMSAGGGRVTVSGGLHMHPHASLLSLLLLYT
jgi:hypothetical protein